MAKPRELFNTPAPQAMGQMGQGIADAYARAGEIEGKGMQALGQGIAQGITSAASSIAGAYGDYKKMNSQVKTQEKSLDTFMPYLPEEIQATITQQREALNNNPKTSLADKKAYYDSTMSFAGGALGQYYKMQEFSQNAAIQQYLKLFGTPNAATPTPTPAVNPPPQFTPTPVASPTIQKEGTVISPGIVVLPGQTKKSPWSKFESTNMGFGD